MNTISFLVINFVFVSAVSLNHNELYPSILKIERILRSEISYSDIKLDYERANIAGKRIKEP